MNSTFTQGHYADPQHPQIRTPSYLGQCDEALRAKRVQIVGELPASARVIDTRYVVSDIHADTVRRFDTKGMPTPKRRCSTFASNWIIENSGARMSSGIGARASRNVLIFIKQVKIQSSLAAPGKPPEIVGLIEQGHLPQIGIAVRAHMCRALQLSPSSSCRLPRT